MDKKGSVLMIALWIVMFLVMFALSLGNNVFLNLRLARYQRDSLKAVWLAKSGINRAVWELEHDPNGDYDGLDESWSTGLDGSGKGIFENVKLREDCEGVFNVRYLFDKTKDKYLAVEDEERKLNVNAAKKEQLIELFTSAGFSGDAFELSEFILKWRGSTVTMEDIFKKEVLRVPEELLLVFEYFYQQKPMEKEEARAKAQELFNKIKDWVTVYGAGSTGQLNINTASYDTLAILVNAKAQGDKVKEGAVADITDRIIKLRGEKHLTKSGDVSFDGLIDKEQSLLDDLMKAVVFKSNNFRIQSAGSFANAARHIDVVYDRSKDKFVYWHER